MARLSNADFVVAWTTSENLEEFCKTTGLTKESAKQRAKRLRTAGVRLKKMPQHYDPLDKLKVAQLNSLVNKHERNR